MLNFYGKSFSSRLLIGTALYPSPAIMQGAIRASGANIVTVSLRREAAGGKSGDALVADPRLSVTVLPKHDRLPQRARGGDHRKAGARIVRHVLISWK
jgi:thiazole synthase ThiGH ThiG subunit